MALNSQRPFRVVSPAVMAIDGAKLALNGYRVYNFTLTYSMLLKKEVVNIRISVRSPLAGVPMLVQRGSHEFIHPKVIDGGDLVFSFSVDVDLSGSEPNFLGKNVHGPKGGRFIYVNSGARAGQPRSCWDRRAKISLMSIGRDQISAVLGSGGVIATEFGGVGKDGGPACASIHGIIWRVENK